MCSRSESGAARGAHASLGPRVLLQPLGKLSATPVTLNACTESEYSILVRAKKDCLSSAADAPSAKIGHQDAVVSQQLLSS